MPPARQSERRGGREAGAAEGFFQLGRAARFQGRVLGSGMVLVHGQLGGVIALDGDLVFASDGRAAELTGRVERLRIEGRFHGSMKVAGAVELAREAVFEGEVEARRLETTEGSRFEGMLRIVP
ncbi:MAG: polymer-forming cytoskeletal protein [Acidobacteriota bacterium]|nr:MAG: polymer-forming cytoskeletal protein [Acidobacteriota bacterium]